jgi:hypothetical protein
MSRGIRPRCVGEANLRVENGSLIDWRPALAVLHTHLADAAWQGANARVVITDHWARYAIVPWSDDISNSEERLAHGRICLANIYGNVADQWRVNVSEAAPGEARVACAIPETLLGEIRTTLDAYRLPLVSAQPQLIAAYNGWRDRLPDANGWFVTIDEGTLTAARLVRGGWDRVYSARIGTDWMVELQRLKTFGRLAAQDGENGRVYVDAPMWLRELAGDCGAGIEWLVDERIESTAGDNLFVLKRPYA